LVLIGLTIFQMIIGELIPKSLALQMPTRMALWTVLPMQWSQGMFAWFIRLLNGSGALILHLVGVRQSGHRHVHSPEEIEFLIAESGRGGVFKPSEQLRLRHALQLGRRPARDLMVPRVHIEALDVDASFDDALAVAINSPYTRIPLYEDSIDYVVGVLHTRELAVASQSETRPTLRSLMRPPLVLPELIPADQLLVRFKAERRTMAILVDEFGGTAGLITVDNILDELIGDIADEFRPSPPSPERLPDGRVRLPGSLAVDDAVQWVRAPWRKTAATVGGAVIAALGRSPRPGDRIVIDGADVEVERVEHRAVVSVIVRPAGRDRRDSGVA
jgi:CBS domain containing-hemolysin-like protein